jgi:F-type H+-transporting ATPase subunit c
MKKTRTAKLTKLVILFAALGILLALPTFAQEGGAEGAGAAVNWGVAFAGLGLGIAAAGGAIGQGRAAADALAGMARNPGASGRIQTALLLSLAFMESLVIFTWVMVFLLR